MTAPFRVAFLFFWIPIQLLSKISMERWRKTIDMQRNL